MSVYAQERYRALMLDLLRGRTAGISPETERTLTAKLSHFWWLMDEAEQKAVETWLSTLDLDESTAP